MKTTKPFLRKIAALAIMCLITLVFVLATQELKAQNVDQLGKKQGTDFPADFLKMDRSGLVTIEVGCQDYMFTVSPGAQGTPLGYVQVGTTDSYAKDYSGYIGTTEFSMNYNDNIINFGRPGGNPGSPVSISLDMDACDCMKVISGNSIGTIRDKNAGSMYLVACIGPEGTTEEELAGKLRLDKMKDGSLVLNALIDDSDAYQSFLARTFPGFGDRAIVNIPLKGSIRDIKTNLRVAKDKSGRYFALMSVYDGLRKIKVDASGNAQLTCTLLKPAEGETSEGVPCVLEICK